MSADKEAEKDLIHAALPLVLLSFTIFSFRSFFCSFQSSQVAPARPSLVRVVNMRLSFHKDLWSFSFIRTKFLQRVCCLWPCVGGERVSHSPEGVKWVLEFGEGRATRVLTAGGGVSDVNRSGDCGDVKGKTQAVYSKQFVKFPLPRRPVGPWWLPVKTVTSRLELQVPSGVSSQSLVIYKLAHRSARQ